MMLLQKALANLMQLHWCKSFSIEFANNSFTNARTLHALFSPSIDEWKTKSEYNYFIVSVCLLIEMFMFNVFLTNVDFLSNFFTEKIAKFQFNSFTKNDQKTPVQM